MSSVAFRFADWLDIETVSQDTAPRTHRTHDAPLIGDIVSARGGVPEHLIQWCRARNDDDPDPML